MTYEETRNALSAKYQVEEPDFCGVNTIIHAAFCAGFDQGFVYAFKASRDSSFDAAKVIKEQLSDAIQDIKPTDKKERGEDQP